MTKNFTFLTFVLLVFIFPKLQAQEKTKFLKLADQNYEVDSFKLAAKYYKKHLKKVKNDSLVLEKLGNSYYQSFAQYLGNRDFSNAQLYFKKYVKTLKQHNALTYEKVKQDYYNLTNGFLSVKNYPKSLRIYEKEMMPLVKESGNKEDTITLLREMGLYFVDLGNYSKAKKYLNRIYPDRDSIYKSANTLLCQGSGKEENSSSFINMDKLDAARMYRFLYKYEKDSTQDQLFNLLIARSYWESGALFKGASLFWYDKIISDKDVENIQKKTQIFVEQDYCQSWRANPNATFSLEEEKKNLDIIRYAELNLNQTGKYLEAKALLKKVIWDDQLDPNAPEIDLFDNVIVVNPVGTESINLSGSEFGPTIYKNDTLLFASDRNTANPVTYNLADEDRRPYDILMYSLMDKDKKGILSIAPQTEKNDLDTASLSNSTDGIETLPKFFQTERNVSYNEGAIAFFPNNWNKAIFTGNYYADKKHLNKRDKLSKAKLNPLKLFIAERPDDTTSWEIVNQVAFSGEMAYLLNDEKVNVGHPTLVQANGKTLMYFSSDVNHNNSDIYFSHFDEESGKFGDIKHLPAVVNTIGNEVFPFVHKDNNENLTLYFSSNRQGGMGGLDIYEIQLDDNGMPIGELKNLKNPDSQINSLNSVGDDFALVMNEMGSGGYFSSDRKNDQDDIYKFRIYKMEIVVMDKDKDQPISKANLSFSGTNVPFHNTDSTDQEGFLNVKQFPLNDYIDFHATAFGYRPGRLGVYTAEDSIPLNGIIRDTIWLEKVPAKVIVLANIESEQQVFIELTKSFDGTTQNGLKVHLEPHVLYELIDENGSNRLINTESETPYSTAIPIGSFFEIKDFDQEQKIKAFNDSLNHHGIIIEKQTIIKNIRYITGRNTFISKDGKVDPQVELQKVTDLMEDYAHLTVKISSHTDKCPYSNFTEDKNNNYRLSERRNQAAKDFLLKQEIKNERIITCAFGQEFPVHNIYPTEPEGFKLRPRDRKVNQKRGTPCKNMYNRRTEFKFIYPNRANFGEDCDCDKSIIYSIDGSRIEPDFIPEKEGPEKLGKL
ncbi:OmpA family protein [Flexithrix dorotheae]|uniref:OmpA family protein n=1 Tax=Flexithrix dorotheae TaxID=70993 RepID=UPI00036A3E74|nr:OmpA family protein [Flexithrix dorotheae]